MFRRVLGPIRRRPVAFVAVFFALGGGAVAASVKGAAPRSAPIDARVFVGGFPAGIEVGAGAVWVGVFTGLRGGEVVRIDPGTKKVLARIPVGGASGLAFGAGAVWASDELTGTVTRIDPHSDRIVARVHVPRYGPHGLAVGAGAVWVADSSGGGTVHIGNETIGFGSVVRIDPRGNRTRIIRAGSGTQRVAVGLGAVWATNTDDSTVTRIDARSGRVVETIPVAPCPIGIVVGAGAVWVTHCSNAIERRPGRVTEIDPRTNRPVAEVAVGKDPNGIAVSGGLVWVANEGGDTITRIDPRTVKVVDTLAVPTGPGRLAPHPADIAAGAGGVWISNNGDGTVARIELSKLRP